MKFLKVILFFLITLAVFAERMEINSDFVETEGNQIHFIGNAKIKIDDSWLHADRVNVYLDENNETRMYEAIGFVKFEFKHEKHSFKGHANEVIYDILLYRYVLRGKAVIDDNDFMIKRRVSGDEIVLNTFTGRVKVKGAPIGTKFFIKLHDFSRLFGI